MCVCMCVSMRVCVCVYKCVSMCVYVVFVCVCSWNRCACTHVPLQMYMYVNEFMNLYECVHLYVHTCMYSDILQKGSTHTKTHTHSCIYVHLHICSCIYIHYVYIHVYVYEPVYTYTYIYHRSSLWTITTPLARDTNAQKYNAGIFECGHFRHPVTTHAPRPWLHQIPTDNCVPLLTKDHHTQSYVTCRTRICQDVFISENDTSICAMAHSYVTWLIFIMWHGAFPYDMTHSCVARRIRMRHDAFICNLTHSQVPQRIRVCLVDMCHDSHRVPIRIQLGASIPPGSRHINPNIPPPTTTTTTAADTVAAVCGYRGCVACPSRAWM